MSIRYFTPQMHMQLRHDHGLRGWYEGIECRRGSSCHICTSSVHQSDSRELNTDEELLASAARLRYFHQNRGCRDEVKSFTAKLRHLAYQWEPSRLVKNILTLVRSTTRSGRAYGLNPPKSDTHTAQAEPFSDMIKEVFPGYRPPSFFGSNFRGLSFASDDWMIRTERTRVKKRLRPVPECKPKDKPKDEPKATDRKVRLRSRIVRGFFSRLTSLVL